MNAIGFIDYYLDEWHANNYPAWIQKSAKNSQGQKAAYAFGERDSPGGISSKSWCEKNSIALCRSIDEVCEKSDYLVILSPDNAEKHLEYAQKALPWGKPVYIDKTFAPAPAEAKEIFRLAEINHTPVCSSSALRFAEEIGPFNGDARSVITLGAGPSFETYAVHQLEIINKVMGCGAEKVMALQNTGNKTLVIRFKDGREAVYNQACGSPAPFTVCIEGNGSGPVLYKTLDSNFFLPFIDRLIEFFAAGRLMANQEDTLEVIGMVEAGTRALDNPFQWIGIGVETV
jgi:hypothetical protein